MKDPCAGEAVLGSRVSRAVIGRIVYIAAPVVVVRSLQYSYCTSVGGTVLYLLRSPYGPYLGAKMRVSSFKGGKGGRRPGLAHAPGPLGFLGSRVYRLAGVS
jgi:hypothetical protein